MSDLYRLTGAALDRANDRALREFDEHRLWQAGEVDYGPVDTLQEHLDHEAGAYANEHQAAFDLSRREFDSGIAAIQRLTDAGRFVVAISGPGYCRFTDALLGTQYTVQSDHATREEADAALAALDPDGVVWQECGVHVFPKLPQPPRAPRTWDDDDVPF